MHDPPVPSKALVTSVGQDLCLVESGRIHKNAHHVQKRTCARFGSPSAFGGNTCTGGSACGGASNDAALVVAVRGRRRCHRRRISVGHDHQYVKRDDNRSDIPTRATSVCLQRDQRIGERRHRRERCLDYRRSSTRGVGDARPALRVNSLEVLETTSSNLT